MCRCQLGLALHSLSRSKGSGVSVEVTQANAETEACYTNTEVSTKQPIITSTRRQTVTMERILWRFEHRPDRGKERGDNEGSGLDALKRQRAHRAGGHCGWVSSESDNMLASLVYFLLTPGVFLCGSTLYLSLHLNTLCLMRNSFTLSGSEFDPSTALPHP
ncbi:unnamed protein product [Leuciscus chuanchicus]